MRWSCHGLDVFPAPVAGQRAKPCERSDSKPIARVVIDWRKADSRFNLKAPDLIWAGVSISVPGCFCYLTGKEALYPKGIGGTLPKDRCGILWSVTMKRRRLPTTFNNTTRTRVTVGAFDLAKVSKFDATFGGIAAGMPALGCHLIEENGALIGGPQSASLAAAGQRYDKDWLFRFGLNPQDFVTAQRRIPGRCDGAAAASGDWVSWRCRVKDFKYTNRGRRLSSVWPAWIAGKCSTRILFAMPRGDRQGDGRRLPA